MMFPAPARWTALLALTLIPCAGAAAPTRPNIVVVVADDLSPAYLSCYGGRTPTPNLDRIAAGGARFERAYSVTPLCNPSRYSLFTGRYPGRNPNVLRGTEEGSPYSLYQNTRLTADEPTLARWLGAAGYITGHVGKWHTNFEYGPLPDIPDTHNPEDPRLDAVLKERTHLQSEAIKRHAGFQHVFATVSGNLETLAKRIPSASHHNPEWQTQGALQFLDLALSSGKPFYLHLANTIPHSPDNLESLDSNPRYSRGGLLDPLPDAHPARSTIRKRLSEFGLPDSGEVGSINAGMLALDDQMGILLDRLEKAGRLQNTLFVFVGDHGVVGKGSPYANGNLVPLLVSWPAVFRKGVAIDTPVSLVDVAPTLAAAALGEVPPGVDGLSLLEMLRTGDTSGLDERPVYIEIGVTRSVIQGHWQYIAFRPSVSTLKRLGAAPSAPAPDIFDTVDQPFIRVNLAHKPSYFEPDQLFDLSVDPFCRRNLAELPEHRDRVEVLRATLGTITRTLPRPFPLETPREMLSDAYRASAKAQHEQERQRMLKVHGFDVEETYNRNLPAPRPTSEQ